MHLLHPLPVFCISPVRQHYQFVIHEPCRLVTRRFQQRIDQRPHPVERLPALPGHSNRTHTPPIQVCLYTCLDPVIRCR